MSVQIAHLPGGRLHLHHGPIDIILRAEGPGAAEGEAAAAARFPAILPGLVAELPALRDAAAPPVTGPVARRMRAAVLAHRGVFVTPMAAVAGAVAEEVLAALVGQGGITRAYVNNGGDIALHLAPGTDTTAALAAGGAIPARITLRAGDPVRGIATSGWRGRSQSLGIADSVTVLAATAAAADVAATLIANAVDLPGHPAVLRRPARAIKADSDLGDRPVTVAVGPLSPAEARRALDRGEAAARAMQAKGLVAAAALLLHPAPLRLVGALMETALVPA